VRRPDGLALGAAQVHADSLIGRPQLYLNLFLGPHRSNRPGLVHCYVATIRHTQVPVASSEASCVEAAPDSHLSHYTALASYLGACSYYSLEAQRRR